MIAIIGGSGLTRLPEMNLSRRQIVRTPYGLPSSTLLFGNIGKLEVVFWRGMALATPSRRTKSITAPMCGLCTMLARAPSSRLRRCTA